MPVIGIEEPVEGARNASFVFLSYINIGYCLRVFLILFLWNRKNFWKKRWSETQILNLWKSLGCCISMLWITCLFPPLYSPLLLSALPSPPQMFIFLRGFPSWDIHHSSRDYDMSLNRQANHEVCSLWTKIAPMQHQGCKVLILKINILQKEEEKSRCQEETCMFHMHALHFALWNMRILKQSLLKWVKGNRANSNPD